MTGVIRSIPVPPAPPGRPVDLVFRSIGERTAALALELAIRHVRPTRAFVVENVKPFSRAVVEMLRIDHGAASHVVHMDADCLILDDLRPFLEQNDLPYVDFYVRDRFRGRIHCGVHVTRMDVVRKMRDTEPPDGDLAFVLRPESRLRNLALSELGAEKQLRGFHILHDWFQRPEDIFAKYALRELRSRTDWQRRRLEGAMQSWGPGRDFDVARAAIDHAARTIPPGAKPKHVEAYIHNLPHIAEREVSRMGLPPEEQLTMSDVESTVRSDPRAQAAPARPKVFGLGLSRTGTRSLTAALHVLGWDTVHYPTDAASFEAMSRGDGAFPLLSQYDGLTDITTIPFVHELDARFPRSKFILTTREEKGWLASCANHWSGRSPFEPIEDEEHRVHMEIRRFLRAAVYGCYDFSPERFARVRNEHHAAMRGYFAKRPGDFLELDVTVGDGWQKLAPFLGVPIPEHPFPHKGKSLSEKMANLEIDD